MDIFDESDLEEYSFAWRLFMEVFSEINHRDSWTSFISGAFSSLLVMEICLHAWWAISFLISSQVLPYLDMMVVLVSWHKRLIFPRLMLWVYFSIFLCEDVSICHVSCNIFRDIDNEALLVGKLASFSCPTFLEYLPRK